MPDQPLVSIVTGVYNGGTSLGPTVESVLVQRGIDFEFIIVDDGSTDETGTVLEDFAHRDDRLKVIHQDHHGLTSALIRGCKQATGNYIARHDVGDISVDDRLAKQVDQFQEDASIVLVSGGSRFIGPKGEILYTVHQDSESADANLRYSDAVRLRGPSHHGCTMFRRNVYERAGGYRPEFIVAQDLDLWTRLAEYGKHAVVPEVLYHATLTPGAISSTRRDLQQKMAEIIVECMRARQVAGDDGLQLKKLVGIHVNEKPVNRHKSDADFYYFISRLLNNSDTKAARHYLAKALRTYPLHYKAWARSFQGLMGF